MKTIRTRGFNHTGPRRGEVFVTPSPSPMHQRISKRLQRQLENYFEERKPNPKDKRSNSIFITDKGAQAFYAADPIADDVRNIFEKGFDQQKLTVAVEVIQTLHDHLKELTSQNGEDQCDS